MMNYGPRRVYAFEPSRINLKQLKNNIAKYGWSDRVTPVEMGLSDSYQMAHMSDGGGAGSKIVQDKNAPTISLTDIDTYVEKHDLCPGLIKLDLEGIESTIIQGAKRTIQKFKPILLISIYHNPRDFFEIKPYLESLGAGYAYMIRKTPYTLYADTMLICF